MAKVAKNGRKVKAIALLFCCFLPTYEKWKKSLKKSDLSVTAEATLFLNNTATQSNMNYITSKLDTQQ
jgi:hypothetical protein